MARDYSARPLGGKSNRSPTRQERTGPGSFCRAGPALPHRRPAVAPEKTAEIRGFPALVDLASCLLMVARDNASALAPGVTEAGDGT